MNNFLGIRDINSIEDILKEMDIAKNDPLKFAKLGAGKSICLLFFNPSLRTRLSTQKAAMNLGMHCISFDTKSGGWQLEFEDGVIMNGDKAEHIREAAAVIGSYFDIIGIRSFPTLTDRDADYGEAIIQKLAQYSHKPVVNLESATRHPLQGLTDLYTIRSLKLKRPKVVLTWAPHVKALPHAVPNSFVEFLKTADVDLVVTSPGGYELPEDIMEGVSYTPDQDEALQGADVVYVKNWSSYSDYGKVIPVGENWIFDQKKLNKTNNAKVMHCLPVRRNVVISDEVLDGPNSIVIEQASNRTWAAQAILKSILSHV